MKEQLNEVKRMQQLAGFVNEATANPVDSIPEMQRYLKDLAVKLPTIKGIDTKEVVNLVAFIDLLVNKLGSGSIGPAIQAATAVLNTRTKNLK